MFKNLPSILCISLLLLIIPLSAISQHSWNHRKCAVVLTYDDALDVHLDNAIPILDSLGLKATFYISAYSPGCSQRLEDWKRAAAHGHELGNHTLFHPCIGQRAGREWVSAERDLNRYTMNRFLEELRMTNVFLKSLDSKTERTLAYPCGDTLVEGQSVIPRISSDFVSARGVTSKLVPLHTRNLFNVDAFGINGESGAQMIALVREAMRTNSAIVFLFHGVGGGHALNVDLKAHRELLTFLKANEKDIWVAPFLDVTRYINENGR